MALPKGNWATDTFTNIATRTKAQSSAVRQWLNKASVDIKAYINDTLTPAIDTAINAINTALENKADSEYVEDRLDNIVLGLTMHEDIGLNPNPHQISKTTIGLENVDDTSDSDKPISTATQNALDNKAYFSDFDDLRTDYNYFSSIVNKALSKHLIFYNTNPSTSNAEHRLYLDGIGEAFTIPDNCAMSCSGTLVVKREGSTNCQLLTVKGLISKNTSASSVSNVNCDFTSAMYIGGTDATASIFADDETGLMYIKVIPDAGVTERFVCDLDITITRDNGGI